MTARDNELEQFKQLPINYAAAALGFRIIRNKSSRNSAVMVRDGHKIICATARHDGHGIWFDTTGNGGSVIDLVMHVHNCNLGQARQVLRPLLRPGALPQDAETTGGHLTPTQTNYLAVLARFSNYEPITYPHDYLCNTRKIPAEILLSHRFKGRIFHDTRGNAALSEAKTMAIFPHYGSPDGSKDRCLTGYSIKGIDTTMFSKGGTKGLWPSNFYPSDDCLVITEAAIDALSYACLQTDFSFMRFISTGGQLNQVQPALIASAIEKLPPQKGGKVILALDNDDGGHQLAGKLTQIFNDTVRELHPTGRDDLSLTVDMPPTRGHDWNTVLVNSLSRLGHE